MYTCLNSSWSQSRRYLFSMERHRPVFKRLFPPNLFGTFIDIGHYRYNLSAYSQLVHAINNLPVWHDICMYDVIMMSCMFVLHSGKWESHSSDKHRTDQSKQRSHFYHRRVCGAGAAGLRSIWQCLQSPQGSKQWSVLRSEGDSLQSGCDWSYLWGAECKPGTADERGGDNERTVETSKRSQVPQMLSGRWAVWRWLWNDVCSINTCV